MRTFPLRAHLGTTTKSARKRSAAVCGAPAAAARRGHAFWDHSATLGIRTCCGWSFGHSRGPVVVPRCAQGSRRGKKDRVTANNRKDFRSRSGETPITVRFNRLKPAAALRASLCEAWRLDIYEPQRGSVPKPNVVPRLRDYVGLTCQPDGNPKGLAAPFGHGSIINCHLVS